MSQRTGCLGGGMFAVYATFVVFAYMIALMDHNTGGAALYKGYIGAIALFLAGFPWSFMLVEPMGLSETAAYTLLYLFPILNLAVTGWLAFRIRRKPTDPAE